VVRGPWSSAPVATGGADIGIFVANRNALRESNLNHTSHRGDLVRGWSASGDLVASVIAGLLIGLGLDAWLDTSPLFVVILVVVGSIGGFLRLKSESGEIEEQAREAIRIRDGL
jgi:F0F1-type ATP synthase assembly protein I